ncbi:hypothetical protein T492DRAFT_1141306 [Pavlovales sp. CCMP2436]|nr:hypothetical protein T492DRAFT_1141306 [Pavlovales sp. CCMP2436]
MCRGAPGWLKKKKKKVVYVAVCHACYIGWGSVGFGGDVRDGFRGIEFNLSRNGHHLNRSRSLIPAGRGREGGNGELVRLLGRGWVAVSAEVRPGSKGTRKADSNGFGGNAQGEFGRASPAGSVGIAGRIQTGSEGTRGLNSVWFEWDARAEFSLVRRRHMDCVKPGSEETQEPTEQ